MQVKKNTSKPLAQPMVAKDRLSESEEQLSPQDAIAGLSAIRDRLQQLERKDWQLWTAAIAVLLLMGAALALPLAPLWTQLYIALLFSGYAVAQQIVTKRIRAELSRQIDSMLLSRQIDSMLLSRQIDSMLLSRQIDSMLLPPD